MKKLLTVAGLLVSIGLSFGQGYVFFDNTVGTRISTNSLAGGPSAGTTRTNIGSYYYALFVAPTTQTTVDATFTGWTFTGNYGTNSSVTGRLKGNSLDSGTAVAIPNYSPGNQVNFVVLGWSANLGRDYQAVLGELAYYQSHGVVHGVNEWIGWSSVATNLVLASFGGPYNFIFGTGPGLAHGFLLGLYPGGSPFITNQPQSQIVLAGQDATFNVGAAGTDPLTYTWLFNGSPISGATNATYTVVNAQAGDAGAYSVNVANLTGSVLSSNAVLTVLFPPSIITQPQSQTVLAGTNVVLSVTVTSSPSSTYQWKRQGTNLPAATTATLSLPNVQWPDSGAYTVAVTNSVGYAISSNATLTVLAPPTITLQPQGLVGYWGRTAVLTVGAQGSAPLSYQWYKDGVLISGATNASLVLTELELNDGGQYSSVVSNPYGSFTSDNALLVVNPAGITLGVYPGLTIEGAVGKTYSIQYTYTTNIANPNLWTTLATITLTQAVQMWFDGDANINSGTNPNRFYRVLAVP
jgi:hypothetical protein